ncbi:NHL repeat-containing protein [Pseudovirgaria hyperparasitica]|uniref:NHL repeat-containing protein n=1 Tax=Pseudovirgaria hyperparasitica TaxID=470096 RepID=A0A6A6WC58_9PEZI|nr:NHL repeat-containing protein [Pseudovirgaria hyperparasitica]KAF2760422.1 NHL repeat-containing protein [Pseudovirgaria hyperparasitica]
MRPLLVSALAAVVVAAPAPEFIHGDSDASLFRFYDNPDFLQGPCDITTGPDGNIWTQNFLDNSISKIEIESGKVTNYKIPYSPDQLYNTTNLPLTGRIAFACAIQPGKDGNLYAATGVRSQFLKINPATGFIKVFTPPLPNVPLLGNIQPFNDLWPDETGMYYSLTTAGTLYHFDYATETFDGVYPLPTPLNGVVGVYVDQQQGNVWLAEFFGQKIAKFNPSTKTFTEYPLPLDGLGIVVVRAETEQRYIWFTGFLSGTNVRFDMATDEIKVFHDTGLLGLASLPTENTVDTRHDCMWYSTASRNTIQYIDTNGVTTIIDMPDNGITQPLGVPPGLNIAIHYNGGDDNAIYFSQTLRNRIGRYQLGP